MKIAQNIYFSLPYVGKVAVASLAGWQRERFRYDIHLEERVAAALERDYWSDAQWQNWRAQQCAELLTRAVTQVPYYREYWHNRRAHGDYTDWGDLNAWPVLNKKVFRQNPRAFLTEDVNLRTLHEEHTSGSTGTPLTLWRSRETEKYWYALFEARTRRWHDVRHGQPWGIFGGQLVTQSDRKRPPYWVWNAASRQLYFSAYHLSPATCGAYANAIGEYQLEYLLGYASTLSNLAAMCKAQSVDLPKVKVVFSNAEPLFTWQRVIIEKGFQCKVVDTYGMSELSAAASECPSGTLHLWPDVGQVEILQPDRDEPALQGENGRMICTSWLNQDMPLIRYEVGDSARLSPQTECACGRTLPGLVCIEGRLDDVLFTQDGRQIGRLDPVFKTDFDIVEAQIIQHDLTHLSVNIVPGPRFSSDCVEAIRSRLIERMGLVEVDIDLVHAIPRGQNGKFKAVINLLMDKNGLSNGQSDTSH